MNEIFLIYVVVLTSSNINYQTKKSAVDFMTSHELVELVSFYLIIKSLITFQFFKIYASHDKKVIEVWCLQSILLDASSARGWIKEPSCIQKI